ncbi:1-acyl-sn-glycerol-3-phosphate acyltransferase [bacterium]|nr:MAG: 1-acyl-sn-glycerol-3-phosphate acyltransferase [bacterium]
MCARPCPRRILSFRLPAGLSGVTVSGWPTAAGPAIECTGRDGPGECAIQAWRKSNLELPSESLPLRRANPLRLAWIAIGTTACTLVQSCLVMVARGDGAKVRRRVDSIARTWSKQLLDLVEASVEVHGDFAASVEPGKPVIVMCNHSSLYDIPISFLSIPGSLRMLTKKELFQIPLFSGAMRRGEFVSIDRKDREQAIKDLELARLKMEDGIILWVAPEGTRSHDGKLGAFKGGAIRLAIQTGATIVPIAIKNSHEIQSGKHVAAVLGQQVQVEIGSPIDATDYSIRERGKLSAAVRNSMLAMLGQTTGDSTGNREGEVAG